MSGRLCTRPRPQVKRKNPGRRLNRCHADEQARRHDMLLSHASSVLMTATADAPPVIRSVTRIQCQSGHMPYCLKLRERIFMPSVARRVPTASTSACSRTDITVRGQALDKRGHRRGAQSTTVFHTRRERRSAAESVATSCIEMRRRRMTGGALVERTSTQASPQKAGGSLACQRSRCVCSDAHAHRAVVAPGAVV